MDVLAIILVVIIGLVALAILAWAMLELWELARWVFPRNKDDEKGPFGDP